MNKYTIRWEVSQQITIHALDEEQALEMVNNGDINNNDIEELEITLQPYIVATETPDTN